MSGLTAVCGASGAWVSRWLGDVPAERVCGAANAVLSMRRTVMADCMIPGMLDLDVWLVGMMVSLRCYFVPGEMLLDGGFRRMRFVCLLATH